MIVLQNKTVYIGMNHADNRSFAWQAKNGEEKTL